VLCALVVGLALVCVTILEAVTVSSGGAAVLLLTTAGLVMLPGVICVRYALGNTSAARGAAWLVGPALGCGLGVTGVLVFWAAGVQTGWVLVLGPLSVCSLAALFRCRGSLAVMLPALGRRDVLPLIAALSLVPLITFAPYAKVGSHLPEGDAYRAYFTADFVWAMSAAAEIAKGDVPPVNPFHHGEPMRYYWMAHMLSGAEYRVFHPFGISVESILLVNGIVFGLSFIALVYWLARAIGASPGWSLTAIVLGFAANSYEGIDMLRAILQHHDAWERLRDTNVDAVTRWFYKGMAVDGLHRLLLYQPHHLAGYAFALCALWLVALTVDVAAVSVALCAGVLLALGLLFSTFGALIVSIAVALVFVVRVQQQRAWKMLPQCGILAGGTLLLGVEMTRVLGYTNASDGLLMAVGPNPVALHTWPWVMFLSFGPLLLFGVPTLLRPQWTRGVGVAPAALAVVSTAFYFLVDVPDMGGVWVGWRTGHMLLLAFAVAAAAGLTALWRIAESKLAIVAVVSVAAALAVPTVVIDVFNAQDIDNREDGAGFPWTLIITPDEREAFDWIRANTPPDAVIQAEPFARDPATWAYIPAFAERRMAAGIPISMIPRRHYTSASEDVRFGIFQASTASDAHDWAELLTIDYVLIGDRERHTYGPQVSRMLARQDLFATVFRNDAILLLKVLRSEGVAAHRQ
jgi:hypothetical protein